MPGELYEDPPHRVSLYRLTSTEGIAEYTYVLVASGVPCSIDTHGASRPSIFDQNQNVVSATIAMKTQTLTDYTGGLLPQRGWKAVADDTGDDYLFTGGISPGRSYDRTATSIPAFTYFDSEWWFAAQEESS